MSATSAFELTPNRLIGGSMPCFIIAEIGQNHQGDVNLAMELIKTAAYMKCDCVKFQKCYLTEKFTRSALERAYNSPHSFGSTYGEHKARLQLTDEQFYNLQQYAQNEGIPFTASAMDIKSVDFLCQMNVPFIKIGSGDTNNYPLIRHVAKKNVPVVLSTGMQNFKVVQQAYNDLIRDLNRLCVLHCVSSYPTLPPDVNLNVLDTYYDAFPSAVIGYSGHELGIDISLAAVAKGAKVLERHLTMDKTLKGNDHQCSLDPHEFGTMVSSIRRIERALGGAVKEVQKSEMACLMKLGKSVVTRRSLKSGAIIAEEDMDVKVSEPNGIPPQEWDNVIGRRIVRDILADCPITYSDLE